MSVAVPPIPERQIDGHKGDFGRVAIVGGCHDDDQVMLGAPVLAGRAALRAGCGGVQLLVPAPLANAALVQLFECIVAPLAVRDSGHLDPVQVLPRIRRVQCDAMVVGPGLGQARSTRELLQGVLAADGPPLVVDADGLNSLVRCDAGMWPVRREVVLTPHPGEYARLAQWLNLPDAGRTAQSRSAAAAALAAATGATVVLKGHGTVVADATSTWTCDEGCNVLAVPGSGDVLAGLVAAMIAMCRRAGEGDLASACRLAVQVHARAGVRHAATVASRGMLAHELADHVAIVMEEDSA